MARLALAITMALLAGCRFSMVEPQPLTGPQPSGVAVWPSLPVDFAEDEAALLTGLDLAVRSRGYRTTSLEVGRQLLSEAGLWVSHAEAPRDAAAVGRALGVDALLLLEVREFEATRGEFRDARWDLVWRLVSTRGGGVLWQYAHHGTWNRSREQRVDPLRRLDAEPDIVPIGGPRAWDFRSTADLAANLHWLALAHLPAAKK